MIAKPSIALSELLGKGADCDLARDDHRTARDGGRREYLRLLLWRAQPRASEWLQRLPGTALGDPRRFSEREDPEAALRQLLPTFSGTAPTPPRRCWPQ
jgi:hypothetical protein